MSILGWQRKGDNSQGGATAGPAAEGQPREVSTIPVGGGSAGPPRGPTEGRQVYSVRVRPSFKGEILSLVAKRQLQRQRRSGKARRVTEGEVMEVMLDAYRAFYRNGEMVGRAVPIPTVVWEGLERIAHELQMPVPDAFEHLVVEKLNQLAVMQRT